MEKNNPCLTCGACCAYFRVSFYWVEADDATPGGVPVHLTRKISEHRRAMISAGGEGHRCISLEGVVGREVMCAIHPGRPSPCRDFEASWVNGVRNGRCDMARAFWGLRPLSPDDFGEDHHDANP